MNCIQNCGNWSLDKYPFGRATLREKYNIIADYKRIHAGNDRGGHVVREADMFFFKEEDAKEYNKYL
jgi:hypothetical protein